MDYTDYVSTTIYVDDELLGFDAETRLRIRRGLSQRGTIDRGSFADYAKNETISGPSRGGDRADRAGSGLWHISEIQKPAG